MKAQVCAVLLAVTNLISPLAAQPLPFELGTPVEDMVGREVGTVIAADEATVTVRTDRHDIRIPTTSTAQYNGVLLIAMTRQELNAAADRMLASAASAASASGIRPSAAEAAHE